MGAVDKSLCQVELSAITKVLGERAQDSLERLVLDPCLKSPMAGLVRRIPTRKIRPRCAGAKHPENAIDDCPCFLPRTSALLRRSLELLGGEAAFDRRPLLIGEVHPQP